MPQLVRRECLCRSYAAWGGGWRVGQGASGPAMLQANTESAARPSHCKRIAPKYGLHHAGGWQWPAISHVLHGLQMVNTLPKIMKVVGCCVVTLCWGRWLGTAHLQLQHEKAIPCGLHSSPYQPLQEAQEDHLHMSSQPRYSLHGSAYLHGSLLMQHEVLTFGRHS